jgi:hypothetical protein
MMEAGRNLWHPEVMPDRCADDSVLIIGAGPTGLEAAISPGRRGCRVTLAAADAATGGRVRREAALPDLAGFDPGCADLTSTPGAPDLEIPADHPVPVADRVPEDSLARALIQCPGRVRAAGILSVDCFGDCLAPGLIADAVHAGHKLSRTF